MDTHVLVEFAQVGLTEAVLEVFRGRLELPGAIEYEVRNSYDPNKGNVPGLAPYLANPKPYRVHQVEDENEQLMARHLQNDWAARKGKPYVWHKDLGEAEAMVLCRRNKWPFITGDHDPITDAHEMRVPVWCPTWVLLTLVLKGKIADGPAAWKLYYRIVRQLGYNEWHRTPMNADGESRFLQRAAALTP
jgi:hypothetical protein